MIELNLFHLIRRPTFFEDRDQKKTVKIEGSYTLLTIPKYGRTN